MTNKKLLYVLKNNMETPPPFWFMRQAGRYLPEYKLIRKQTKNFLDLCYDTMNATKVTLQPIHRWNPDGAILFSDILVVPHALGQKVDFQEGYGPILEPLTSVDNLENFNHEKFNSHLSPVYQTIKNLRTQLPPHTTLIGFSGAPWTVAVYMIEGRSSKEWTAARIWLYKEPKKFEQLINLIVTATSEYLIQQIKSGAEVIQIFDSWAGILTDIEFAKWVIEPTKQIIFNVRKFNPDIPIIGFPRNAGILYRKFVKETKVDGISLDHSVPLKWAAEELQKLTVIQGNLDNHLVLAGGRALKLRVEEILNTFKKGPFIFNLGHGVLPTTPLENIEMIVKLIKNTGVSDES